MSSVNVNLSHDKFRILVHGGAWDIPGRLMEAHRAGVRKAWQVAAHALESGAAPLEAVARTLACMEDDPVFDAGRGSFLNEDGEVELDASVMRGSDLQAGCVAAIRNFPNPSRIALALLLEGQNVLLAGSGAERFARSKGFSPVPACDLVHPREAEAHKAWIKAGKPDSKVYFSKPPYSAPVSEAAPAGPCRRARAARHRRLRPRSPGAAGRVRALRRHFHRRRAGQEEGASRRRADSRRRHHSRR